MPDDNEVDLAASTTLAVRTLRASEQEDRENLLVYYGSGISTSGLINMTEVPVYKLDPDSSAKTIASALNQDLSGIHVIWYCCGDVAGKDQPSLSEKEKERMKEFYKDLFDSMGADEVTFMEDIPQDGSYHFEREVSVMDTADMAGELIEGEMPEPEPETETVTEKETEEIFAEGEILSFDEMSIAFKPDSTELSDKDAAMNALSYVIDYMNMHPDFTLLICGTTTTAGEEASCIEFSQKRAEAIRSLLIQNAGIGEDRIHTIGCGWSSCLYIPDRGEDGKLNENAPLNRSVKLVDYNSEMAREIADSVVQ